MVSKELRENEFDIKKEMCSFDINEVMLLGHKIKDGMLMMDEGKVKAIQEWEALTKVIKLRSFLRLVNYYQ